MNLSQGTTAALPDVYLRVQDYFPDLEIEAGFAPVNGSVMIRLEQRDLSPFDALDLAEILISAARCFAARTSEELDA